MLHSRKGDEFFLVLVGLSFSLIMALVERGGLVSDLSVVAFGNFVGWLLFFAYFAFLYCRSPGLIAAMLWQFLYFISMMVSATVISLGGYMYEIKDVGFHNGEFWVLLSFLMISCESQRLGLSFSKKINIAGGVISSRSFEVVVSKSLVFFVLGISFYILLRYGSPLLADVNRVKYWGEVAPSYFSFVRVLVICTFFLVAYFVMQTKKGAAKDGFHRVSLFLYVFLAFVLFGEKFSLLVFYIFAWLVLTAAIRGEEGVRKSLRWIILIFFVLLVNVGVVYEVMGLGFDFIANRIASEGQVLWSVLNENAGVIVCGLSCSSTVDWTLVGVREFIDGRYLPLETYLLNQISGTSLTGYFPSWQVLFFGVPFSLVLHFLASVLLGFVQGSIVDGVARSNVLLSFMYFILYFFLIAVWYVGNFNLFPAICLVAALIFLIHIAVFSFKKISNHV